MKKTNLKQPKFNKNLFTLCLILVLLTTVSMHLTYKALKKTKSEIITYKEKSTIDYKIVLKENNFYENKDLDEGQAYIASLIDKIKFNFNYTFNVNKSANISFKYKMLAKLVIRSQDSSNIFYEKNFDLTEEIVDNAKEINAYYISKNVNIDYNYYNALALKFKSNYKVNTISYLNVYLIVNSENNEYLKINDINKAVATIPLAKEEVDITIKENDKDNEKEVISPSKIIVKNYKYVILTIFTTIITMYVFVKLFIEVKKSSFRKNKYERFVNKILRSYDRLIVNVKFLPKFDDYTVYNVNNFDELVDALDSFREPIKYFASKTRKESVFFITHRKEVYIYTVRKENFYE